MLILVLRTDKPDAEVGLFVDTEQIAYEIWQAHRALAETLLQKIEALLQSHTKSWHDIEGVVVFKGPGSFTGLRIGITVANTIAQSENVPIVASETDEWVKTGIEQLLNGQNERLAMPEYGSAPHITPQKK